MLIFLGFVSFGPTNQYLFAKQYLDACVFHNCYCSNMGVVMMMKMMTMMNYLMPAIMQLGQSVVRAAQTKHFKAALRAKPQSVATNLLGPQCCSDHSCCSVLPLHISEVWGSLKDSWLHTLSLSREPLYQSPHTAFAKERDK